MPRKAPPASRRSILVPTKAGNLAQINIPVDFVISRFAVELHLISITSGADVRVFYMQMPDPTMHTAQVTDKLVVRPMVRLSTMVKVLIAIGLVCIAIVAYLVASRSGAPTQFVTRSVTRGAITQSVTATGYVNPVLTITVGSYVSGVIQSIYCDYNTHVTKGQLCAKIDARPYQAVVDQDQASL